jgi:hypothetical protein
MKLTSVERIGRSQLIPGVRQTTGDGEERDEYDERMPADGTNG